MPFLKNKNTPSFGIIVTWNFAILLGNSIGEQSPSKKKKIFHCLCKNKMLIFLLFENLRGINPKRNVDYDHN